MSAKGSGGSTTKSAVYQPSLFHVRSGLRSNKRSRDDSLQRDTHDTTKRQKADIVELGPDGGGKGTTIDPKELRPVTRESFLQVHGVEGIKGVYYQRDWIDAKTALRWHNDLLALEQWYQPKLKVYGREIQQSRRIAAFATSSGLDLKYSGHQVDMHAPFPPVLERIAARLSSDDCLGSDVKFNHAMLNHYADGQVYIGKHSDNLENKVIVTVSLGAARTWIMEEKKTRNSPEKGVRHKWVLENGSILVMQGDVQQRYTHEIPKEAKVKDSRISITFRQLVY